MNQYRSASAVVEAVRLDMKDRVATRRLLEGMGAFPGTYEMPVVFGKACWWKQTFPDGDDKPAVFFLVVPTEQGQIDAADGDWIVKTDPDHIVPMKPEAFAATYEAIE